MRRPDLRAGVRWARESRLLGRPVRLLDRVWWARVILQSKVVDADYVSAQLGRRVGVAGATLLYVGRGFRQGLRLNPLFVDTAVGDHLPQAHRVPALYAYLIADPRGLEISPIWSAAAYLRRHPDRASEVGGALGAVWRRRYDDSIPLGADAETPGPEWAKVHRTVREAATSAREDATDNVDGDARTSKPAVEFVIILDADEWDFDESIALAAELAGRPDCGVTIVQRGGRVEDWVQSALLATVSGRVRAMRVSDERRTIDPVTILDHIDAPVVVWRGANDDVSAETLRELAVAAAEGELVGPLWLDADGTIASAGAVAQGRLLAGHPAEDASLLPGAPFARVPALAGSTFAARRDLALSPAGAGPDRATPVSMRAMAASTPIMLRTDLSARVRAGAPPEHLPSGLPDGAPLLSDAGWQCVADGPSPRLRRRARTHVLDDGTVVPVLRWALCTAAPVGLRGEWWGDVHFARALAEALRRLGQEVVVDAYPARARSTRHLDDVTIALRGPEPIDPNPHGTSVLWIISHPDQIRPDMLDGFDLVYAASVPWAAGASRRWDRPITPLLQCTDADRFHPRGIARGADIVFVGTARGIYRPSVVEPVRAGVPVKVFGPDWREWIPASAIAGTGVKNEDLPPLYESAAVVLNDHWPSMQRAGFIANRPYDVVAAGGRVISDEVEGISEVFRGAVVTYKDTDELLRLISSDLDAVFPGPRELADIARTIRNRDSFDARARTLLNDVTRHRA